MRLPNPASPHSQQVAGYHHAGDDHDDHDHDHDRDDDDDDYDHAHVHNGDEDDDDDDQAELLLGRVLATNGRAGPAGGTP